MTGKPIKFILNLRLNRRGSRKVSGMGEGGERLQFGLHTLREMSASVATQTTLPLVSL